LLIRIFLEQLQSLSEINSEEFLLSLYLDTFSQTAESIQSKIKSLIKDFSREHLDFEIDFLVEAVLAETNKIVEYPKGLAIFTRFDKSEVRGIFIRELNDVPKEKIHIGKSLDVTELIWLRNIYPKVIVLELTQDNATIREVDGINLIQLFTIENEYIKNIELPDYSRQRFTSNDGGIMSHGTWEDINFEEHENLKFINNDIIPKIEECLAKKNYECLFILHSVKFNKLKEKVREVVRKKYKLEILEKSGNIKNESEIKESVLNTVKEVYKNKINDLVTRFREIDHVNFRKGFPAIIRKLSSSSIDTLILDRNAFFEVYFDPDELALLGESENKRYYYNIVPWLVKRTLNLGGNVFVVDGVDGMVVAKFRY
jgi:hypothetical protein